MLMRTEIMTRKYRALLVDDDPDSLALLRHMLERGFPTLSIETRSQPHVDEGFDLYFVDNDFNGSCLAGELAETIREISSQSLVVAFSARLDAATLKRLINAGCDWVCDKSMPEEMLKMLKMVESYIDMRNSDLQTDSASTGLLPTVRAITELITQWNTRLESDRRIPG